MLVSFRATCADGVSVAPLLLTCPQRQDFVLRLAPFARRDVIDESFWSGPVWLPNAAQYFQALGNSERLSIRLIGGGGSSSEPPSAIVSADPVLSPDPSALQQQPTAEQPTCAPIDSAPEHCFSRELSFRDDLYGFFPRLGHDAWGLVNWNDAAILGVALGGSLAIRYTLDDQVRNWTAEHPDRWGEGSKIIGDIGVAQYQVPVLLGAYIYTVMAQDIEAHQMMGSMISAFTLTGVSTVIIKGIANTHRPSDQWNGGNFGFPSYHTASMFAISAVLDEYEGHTLGVPAYILSGLVGFSRIDTRDHDLSDVVFGGVLGYVIGKSVAGRALYGDSRVHILPYVHPSDGSTGVMIDAAF